MVFFSLINDPKALCYLRCFELNQVPIFTSCNYIKSLATQHMGKNQMQLGIFLTAFDFYLTKKLMWSHLAAHGHENFAQRTHVQSQMITSIEVVKNR